MAYDQFTRVDFSRFKAFKRFRLDLRHFNILVGPNHARRSTILAAFRILAGALRRAPSRKPTPVVGPNSMSMGYPIDLSGVSVADENIFFDYDDSEPSSVRFTLSNQNSLLLYFRSVGDCSLVPDAQGVR